MIARRMRNRFVAALAIVLIVATARAAQNETAANSTKSVEAASAAEALAPSNLLRLGGGSSFYSPFAFLVDKKARRLAVWKSGESGWQRVAEFPADLGKNEGVKTKRNDHRTPEGIYFLKTRLEGSGLDFNLYGSRAFTTDYPNFFDRLEGKTGNGIWLHAVPDKVPLTRGSRGCVVVRNDVIRELTQYVNLGKTPVVISDRLEYVRPSASAALESEIEASIESWRRAWEAKDIAGYIAFYGPQFRSQKMNRDEWREYKDRLNSTYKQLSIKLSRPYVIAYKDRAVARFLQSYASDLHQDFGEKTLYLRKDGGRFKIVGEEWAEESSRLAQEELKVGPALASPADRIPASAPQEKSPAAGESAAGSAPPSVPSQNAARD